MNVQPSHPQPRILIIDDNAAIHDDFRKILGGQNAADMRLGDVEKALFGNPASLAERVTFRIDSAFQGREALQLVQKAGEENDPYALAFVDVRMPPGWDGVETLEHIWQCCPDLQAVICTAYSDYSWDNIARRLGQTDNLLILKKPFETVEVLQMAYALTQKRALARQAQLRMEDLDRMVRERTQELVTTNQKLQQEIAARARASELLRISEEQFSKAFQASPMPMAITSSPEGRFQAANPSFLELAGHTANQLLQRTSDELRLWEDAAGKKTHVTQPEQRIRNRPCVLRRNDGTFRSVMFWAEPITLGVGPCVLLIVEDTTDQLKLEGQLRQAQRMEAVGRLAAGIAHEFNNILTVIQGHAGLLHAKPADPQFVTESAARIAQASQRAASLTKQLLAFSRKQPLQFNPINLSAVVQATQKMLGRLLGERYELRLDCPEDLPPARADEGSVEQMLINLVLNARDAMPDGGPIRVGTSLARCDDSAARKNPDARPGHYACLTVSDAGCGMSQEILNRLFDPFFTTKEVGKGTGLGLATVYGIVKQHGGWIEVHSQEGDGTTFSIYLPTSVPTLKSQISNLKFQRPPPAAEVCGGYETILVVEDEATLRDLAELILREQGYEVFLAADAAEAVQTWQDHSDQIHLLFTDVVMPGEMSGRDLAEKLQACRPDLRVLFTSGYTVEEMNQEGVHFLQKPYDHASLTKAVRDCLDAAVPLTVMAMA